MATQINGTTGKNSSYWRYYLVCTEQEVSIPNNTSKLKVDVYLGATSYSRAVRGSVSATHTVNVNGTNYTFTTGAYTIEKNTNVLLGSITTNAITHDADGSKKVSVTASSPDLAQASGYGPYSGSATGEVTLTTIPRTSSVTCADGNIGSTTTINIVRASDTFTHTLKYAFGTLTGTIVTKTKETSYGWTIPTSFYAQIANAKSGKGTITCETYSGDTLIGSSTCPFNALVLEENNKPTITATVVDSNTTTTALTGDNNKLVKYFSNAKVTMTATAKNSATIKSQKVTCGDGKSSTSATATLNAVESGTFNLTCTDSRGFVGTNTVTKTMVNYIKLAITSLSIARESSTSNTVKISLKGNYFNSSFGSVANTLTLKWRYRLQGGTWSGYTTVTATKSGNTFTYSGTLGTTFDYKQAYEFEVVAQDKLITDTKTQPVTKGTSLIDIWKDNVKINGLLSILKGNALKFDNENTVRKNEHGALIISATGDSGDSNRIYLRPNGDTDSTNQVLITKAGSITVPNLVNLNKINSKTINADFKTAFRTQTRGDTSTNNGFISTIRNDTANVADSPQYGSGLAWGRSDTHGYLYTHHSASSGSHTAIIGGGNKDALNWVGKIAIPKNLYNNESGTTGTITLSESAANFAYIEIFYKKSNSTHLKSVRAYSPNGKSMNLSIQWRIQQGAIQSQTLKVNISGTSITRDAETYHNIYNNGNMDGLDQTDITIIRVDGYR